MARKSLIVFFTENKSEQVLKWWAHSGLYLDFILFTDRSEFSQINSLLETTADFYFISLVNSKLSPRVGLL